eukprot:SAG11_NODE_3597_length_2347_cov_3.269573_6_plen_46_part_00
MQATILEAEKVREVERLDDVEVEDQGQDVSRWLPVRRSRRGKIYH